MAGLADVLPLPPPLLPRQGCIPHSPRYAPSRKKSHRAQYARNTPSGYRKYAGPVGSVTAAARGGERRAENAPPPTPPTRPTLPLPAPSAADHAAHTSAGVAAATTAVLPPTAHKRADADQGTGATAAQRRRCPSPRVTRLPRRPVPPALARWPPPPPPARSTDGAPPPRWAQPSPVVVDACNVHTNSFQLLVVT